MTAIEYRWIPDPMEFANRMDAVAVGLSNMTPPLAAASEEISASIRQRFETETDPEGNEWKDWSENYRDWGTPGRKNKVKGATTGRGMILKDEGTLMRTASSAEAMVIANDTVFYRTDILPNYGLLHELGGGNNVPARPFLGISDEDAAKIEALFFEWAQMNIDLFVTARANIGVRHSVRGTSGRFISRSEAGLGSLPSF